MTRPSGGVEAFNAFFDAMYDLYLRAGEPSFRDLAKRAPLTMSHTAARGVVQGPRLPRVEHVRAIVDVLQGDQTYFMRLWQAAADASQWQPWMGSARPVLDEPAQELPPAPEVPPKHGTAVVEFPKGAMVRREPFWSRELDINSAAPVMQLMAAAVRDGRDVNALLLEIAVNDPGHTAPAISFIAGYDLAGAASMVAAASSAAPNRVAILLSDLLPDPTGRRGGTVRAVDSDAGKAAAIVRLLLDEHGMAPASLIRVAVLLCQPPLSGHLTVVSRVLRDAVRHGETEEIVRILVDLGQEFTVAVVLYGMLCRSDSRPEAAQVLGWLAKSAPDLCVNGFVDMVMKGRRLRRVSGRRSVLGLVASVYQQWASLLVSAVLANPDGAAGRSLGPDLASQILTELADESFEDAVVLTYGFAKRSPRTTVRILSLLADHSMEVAAQLIAEIAVCDPERCGALLQEWLDLRHPYVAAPAGAVVAALAMISPTVTADLLYCTAVRMGAPRVRVRTLAGLSREELRRTERALVSHATTDRWRVIRPFLSPTRW